MCASIAIIQHILNICNPTLSTAITSSASEAKVVFGLLVEEGLRCNRSVMRSLLSRLSAASILAAENSSS